MKEEDHWYADVCVGFDFCNYAEAGWDFSIAEITGLYAKRGSVDKKEGDSDVDYIEGKRESTKGANYGEAEPDQVCFFDPLNPS